jgi:hypothetical protein
VPKFARHCLSLGVKAVYITLNEKVALYTMKNGKVKEKSVVRLVHFKWRFILPVRSMLALPGVLKHQEVKQVGLLGTKVGLRLEV